MAAAAHLIPPNPFPASELRRSVASVTLNSINGCPLRVSFQGSPGAYSELAAKMAIPTCLTLPCRSFLDAISAVESGRADRAVLPVESTMDSVASLRTYDLVLQRDLRISQEISLFVRYRLLAMPGVRAAELRRVISHPMALSHCDRALPADLRRVPVEDTAGAVQMLQSHRLRDTAAIASSRAAQLYGLHVIPDALQAAPWNVTRFLLISSPAAAASAPPPEKAKTSLVLAHRGGSMMLLLKLLNAFSSRSINLTKLEVYNPSAQGKGTVLVLDVRGKGRSLCAFPHVIYIDFQGSTDEPKVQELIRKIQDFSVFVRVLGCYAADSNLYGLH